MRLPSCSPVRNALPRWRGFNLIEMYLYDHTGEGKPRPSFQELDFQWISDWGFDFVRLPLSYYFWSGPERWLEMDEEALVPVDEAIEYGRRYSLHVSLNLHRAPGYCVNPPPEPKSLWRDPEALEACCHHWRVLARRYRGIPSARLSFDLINEPPAPSEDMSRAEHEAVIRDLTAAVRSEDPERLIIADGLGCGTEPAPELADLGIAQSCRAYLPMGLSHYRAPWMGQELLPPPTWPGGGHYGQAWDRSNLEAHYQAWAELIAQGVGVHCGEGGCYRETPHDVFLAWFRDVLELLTYHGIGYALWNFRGPFGVLDSGRDDVAYEDWYGHALDRGLLTLLQEW